MTNATTPATQDELERILETAFHHAGVKDEVCDALLTLYQELAPFGIDADLADDVRIAKAVVRALESASDCPRNLFDDGEPTDDIGLR